MGQKIPRLKLEVFTYLYIKQFEAFFFFQAEDGIRDYKVTGVQTCALPIFDIGKSAIQNRARLLYLHEHLGEAVLQCLEANQRLAKLLAAAQVLARELQHQIGRASCRERGEISGGAGSLKKKKEDIMYGGQ